MDSNSYLQPAQELSTLGRDEEKRRMSSSKRSSTSRPDGEKEPQVVGSSLSLGATYTVGLPGGFKTLSQALKVAGLNDTIMLCGDNPHVDVGRLRQIEYLVNKGWTYTKVSKLFNLSRERVRKIVEDNDLLRIPKGYVTARELAKILEVDIKTITTRCSAHACNSIMRKGRYYIRLSKPFKAQCEICGSMVPIGRHIYCSDACEDVGAKKAWNRSQWRRFYRKAGLKFPPSLAKRINSGVS